jgi:phage-related protein
MDFEVKVVDSAARFIALLPLKMSAKVQRTIGLLRQFGYNLTEPHSKKITGFESLRELRVKQGSDICRLFYFHLGSKTYIVTSGYIKKENKTNRIEIDRAVAIMKKVIKENGA